MRSHTTRLLLTVGSVVLLSFAGGLPTSSLAAELPQADVPVAGRPPVGVDSILVAGTFKVDIQDDASSTAAVAGQGLVNSPWPMFQHDLQHTGRSFYSGPQSPTLKWQFQVAGLPGSPAIGSDGTIYLPTGATNHDITGYLYAINPDGTLKWRFQFAGLPSSTAPAIAADGTIYVHMNGDNGNIVATEKLYAVNPDGTLKWIFLPNDTAGSFTSEVQSSPAIGSDGTIYFGSMNTGFYAVNPDGTLKWGRTITVSSISSSPVIAPDGTIYIQDGFDLAAFSPDGTQLWRRQLADSSASSNASPSIGADGTIYIAEGIELQAINPNGTLKWRYQTAEWGEIVSTPAIAADGTIYIAYDGLYAVNPDGSHKWKFSNNELFSRSSPIIGADGTIYWKGAWIFYAVNPNGTQQWQISVPASSALMPGSVIGSDGTLYISQPDVFSSINQYLRAYQASADTTPDPFTFIDVTGVPLSTVQTSNAITVSGITAPAAISIVGGAYELGSNPGVWTSSSGTVANTDTVRVRHTSAATSSAAVNTTLTIGGVSDTFTSTTLTTGGHTVTTNAAGTGTGNVASNVGGINYNYPANNTGATTSINNGANVVMTATGAGSTTTWGGTCTAAGGTEAGNGTGTSTCTFASLNGNKAATATFTLLTFTWSATVTLNGSEFHTGQTIDYQATLIPGITPMQVDIYLGTLLPDGVTFLSFVQSTPGVISFAFGPSPTPFLANVPLTPTVVPFSYTFTGSESTGAYFTYAGLAIAGSNPLLPENQLALSIQPFQFTP